MVLSEAGKPAIEAVLAEVGAAKLKELAKNYYVKGYSKMNKPTLVQAVSAALRDPGRMESFSTSSTSRHSCCSSGRLGAGSR